LTSRNGAFYVVDSVSLLGGAPLPVDEWTIDVCMTGAQKAIAAPPGISPLSISAKAKKYMIENPPATMYFNLARYFKFYDGEKHTPFTPALPLLYAYREALTMILEEGLQNVFKRHKVCSDALYSGLSAMGLSPFAKEEDRSISIIALNYLDGLEDKTFRSTLADKFKVLVAGGFGDLKGKVLALITLIPERRVVDEVETGVLGLVNRAIIGFYDLVSGHLLSVNADNVGLLNQLYLRKGRLLEAGRDNEVLLSEGFAQVHDLQPGDKISATINGRRKELSIVGHVLSPEYIYQIAPGAMFPDYYRYGILCVAR